MRIYIHLKYQYRMFVEMNPRKHIRNAIVFLFHFNSTEEEEEEKKTGKETN